MVLFTTSVPVVSSTDGLAIIAVRTTSVDSLGHVGVGFQNDDGTWTIGGIENTGGSPVVIPGADNSVGIAPMVGSLYDNGGWVETGKTLLEVEVIFHSLNYDGFKIIQVSDPKPGLAEAKINDFPTRGYDVVNNNCLSATIDVLTEYGVKNLPLQIAHVAPNDYYANVEGEEYLWDTGKKTYTDINTGMSLTDDTSTLQEEQQGDACSVVGKWDLHIKVESWTSSDKELNLDASSIRESIIDLHSDGTFSDSYQTLILEGKWTEYGDAITLQYDQANDDPWTATLYLEGEINGDVMDGTGSVLGYTTGSTPYSLEAMLSWSATRTSAENFV